MTCARFKEVFDLRIFRRKGLFVILEVEFFELKFLIGFAGQDDMLAVYFWVRVCFQVEV